MYRLAALKVLALGRGCTGYSVGAGFGVRRSQIASAASGWTELAHCNTLPWLAGGARGVGQRVRGRIMAACVPHPDCGPVLLSCVALRCAVLRCCPPCRVLRAGGCCSAAAARPTTSAPSCWWSGTGGDREGERWYGTGSGRGKRPGVNNEGACACNGMKLVAPIALCRGFAAPPASHSVPSRTQPLHPLGGHPAHWLEAAGAAAAAGGVWLPGAAAAPRRLL